MGLAKSYSMRSEFQRHRMIERFFTTTAGCMLNTTIEVIGGSPRRGDKVIFLKTTTSDARAIVRRLRGRERSAPLLYRNRFYSRPPAPPPPVWRVRAFPLSRSVLHARLP